MTRSVGGFELKVASIKLRLENKFMISQTKYDVIWRFTAMFMNRNLSWIKRAGNAKVIKIKTTIWFRFHLSNGIRREHCCGGECWKAWKKRENGKKELHEGIEGGRKVKKAIVLIVFKGRIGRVTIVSHTRFETETSIYVDTSKIYFKTF